MIKKFFMDIGDFPLFMMQVIVSVFTPPYRVRLIMNQFIKIGLKSIVIISLTGGTMGLILTQQMMVSLRQFGATETILLVVSKMLATELSPVVSALLLIAKNGSAITSEIGIMKTTNQLDVLKTMNIDPIQYHAPSRVIACTLMFPLLCAYSTVIGMLFSAMLIPLISQVDLAQAVSFLVIRFDTHELLIGIIKSTFFGMSIAIFSLYHGFKSARGAEGLGFATTAGVVASSVSIILLDFLLGKIYVEIFG